MKHIPDNKKTADQLRVRLKEVEESQYRLLSNQTFNKTSVSDFYANYIARLKLMIAEKIGRMK
jgi:hypothetical protein